MSPLTDRVLSFVDLLRANDVRVSTGEVCDALQATALLDDDGAVVERDVLRGVLSACLVKDADDDARFLDLFDLHFRHGLDGAEPSLAVPLAAALEERGLAEDVARALAARLLAPTSDAERADDAAEMDSLVRALVEGDRDRLLELLRLALARLDVRALVSPLQVPYFGQRLLSGVGADARSLARLGARAKDADDEGGAVVEGARDGDHVLGPLLDERLLALRRLAARLVREELSKRSGERALREGALVDRPLRALTVDDEARLRALVRALCERLRARLHARARRTRRGRVDTRAVMRKSLATDGVPMTLAHRRRRRERPDLFVVCDVSDSVRAASSFMLQFVYSLVDLVRRVRAFAFVDRVGEVTELFRAHPIDVAIERVMTGEVVSVSANSDYGRALRELAALHLDGLTRRTTVVVLGDGRTNQRAPEEWVVAEMRRRARQVVWLCPEERGLWGVGDSRMPLYARHVDRAVVVRSLADLSRAVDRLLL